jgi:hypothetical protein
MALVSTVVNRALRLLKAIDAASATPALDHQTAVVALNAMVARWEANGLAMGWAPVSAPDGTLPAPEEAEEALAYNLAVALGPEYPEPSSWGEIKERARISLAELRRDRLTEMPLRQCSDLPPSRGAWNITTDEPA